MFNINNTIIINNNISIVIIYNIFNIKAFNLE